jgi:HK97 gp10 family phage protein
MASPTVKGLPELVASLKKVQNAVAKKVMRKAATAGTKIINKAAKANAPVDTKLLKKAIGQKVVVHRRKGNVSGIVGARVGKGIEGRDPVHYHHFVDRGTKEIQARDGLNTALRANESLIVQTMAGIIQQGIEAAAA